MTRMIIIGPEPRTYTVGEGIGIGLPPHHAKTEIISREQGINFRCKCGIMIFSSICTGDSFDDVECRECGRAYRVSVFHSIGILSEPE